MVLYAGSKGRYFRVMFDSILLFGWAPTLIKFLATQKECLTLECAALLKLYPSATENEPN